MKLSLDTAHGSMPATKTVAAADPWAWLRVLCAPFSPSQSASRTRRAGQILRGESWVIEQPKGQTIVCRQGALWITHDGDGEDHFLECGERYVAATGSRMIVSAMTDAYVCNIP